MECGHLNNAPVLCDVGILNICSVFFRRPFGLDLWVFIFSFLHGSRPLLTGSLKKKIRWAAFPNTCVRILGPPIFFLKKGGPNLGPPNIFLKTVCAQRACVIQKHKKNMHSSILGTKKFSSKIFQNYAHSPCFWNTYSMPSVFSLFAIFSLRLQCLVKACYIFALAFAIAILIYRRKFIAAF